MTLRPGDLIFTGNPGTTEASKLGDILEVELDATNVGFLPVVAANVRARARTTLMEITGTNMNSTDQERLDEASDDADAWLE